MEITANIASIHFAKPIKTTIFGFFERIFSKITGQKGRNHA